MITGIVIGVILIAGGGYIYNNFNFDKPLLREIKKAGIVEKEVSISWMNMIRDLVIHSMIVRG